MTLHVAVSGWLLGEPSGANRRLLAIVGAAAPLLAAGERITVLHGAGFAPPRLHDRVDWLRVAIPPGPTWRRVLAERRLLDGVMRELGATVLDHALLPLPRTGARVVLTVHDLRTIDGHGERRRPRWLHRAVLRRAVRRADAVVVPSAFTQARIAAVAPGAVVHVIGNGVDAVAAPASMRGAAVPSPADAPVLLHVGHLERRKNLDVVLRALALLPVDVRPELRAIGSDHGALAGLRRLACELGVADRVRWLGRVGDDELARSYATATAVVVPSRYEGFGLPALEALAHGRPVLVADAAALPEVVGDAGTVLPPDDPRAWADAIRAAIAPIADMAAERGAAARRRNRATAASWTDAAARTVELWRRVAGPAVAR